MNRARGAWALTGATVAVAAALYWPWVSRLASPQHRLPVVVFVVLFAAAEVFVVHVEFRRDAHTVSLVEIPLVMALFFAPTMWLVPAHLIGAGLALTLVRRQRPVKLAYNLAAFALEDVVALLVFHGFAASSPLSVGAWVAAFVAALVSSLLAVLAVTLVIAVTGGSQTWRQRRQSISFSVAATAITASTAIALAVLEQQDTRAALLLAAPILAIYVANRLLLAQRNDRRSMALLSVSSGMLHNDHDTAQALRGVLEQTRSLFAADVAALTYAPANDASSAALLVVGPGREVRPLCITDRTSTWGEWERLAPSRQGNILSPHRDPGAHMLGDLVVRNGVVAPLMLGPRVVGYLLVANRVSEVTGFSATDLLVLTTVANQLSAAVEDGELEQPLHQLRVLERQLAYRESHDTLTGLATPGAFHDELASRLADPGLESDDLAAIVIDLFDSSGDALADDVLLVAAERLGRVLRQQDTVARLTDARLAVIAATSGADSLPGQLCRRVEGALASTVHVAGRTTELQIQLGVATNRVPDTAEDMLDRALLAMVVR